MNVIQKRFIPLAWRLGLTLGPVLTMQGQLAESTDNPDDEGGTFELSPFEVTGEDSNGYAASSTLAGTRLRTDLRDIASSVSVVTSEFLKDTGATGNEDLLVYTTNTEVGGVYGNFSGMGGAPTFNENSNLLRPSQNTRVRGLDAADNTRDYFLSEIPWDGYNVDRVELQRGPNSILFGVGSPAGIVNTTLKSAIYEDLSEIELRVGSFGSVRTSFDFNRELIDETLAVRITGVYDETKFQQDPAFDLDKRIFGAFRYEPKWFGDGVVTTIRGNFEVGDVSANRPRSLPPIDAITPWFQSGSVNGVPYPNKLTLNPVTTYEQYGKWNGSDSFYPWFREAFLGRMFNADIGYFFNAGNGEILNVQMPTLSTPFGIYGDPEHPEKVGTRDGTIDGLPFARPWAITTFNNYARGALGNEGKYYSNYSLSDPSIFNFYDKLIDGPNKEEWQEWKSGSLNLAQTFLHNRVGYELSYFGQRYEDGQYAFLNGDQYLIGIDINTHLLDGSPNPNVGRPYVGNSGQYGSNENYIDRDSYRATAFADFRFDDVLEESWLTHLLGRHVLTGLASKDVRETDFRNFARWASDPAYTESLGLSSSIQDGLRQVDWLAYLGPSLLNANSAAGANLNNVANRFDPVGSATVRHFDSHWDSPNVDPSTPYQFISYDSSGNQVINDSWESENPARYVGWTSSTFNVIGAESGNIRDLYTQVQKSRNKIESIGLTLQSYLVNDNVVVTYGWRRDRVKTVSGQGEKLQYGVSDPDTPLREIDDGSDDDNTRHADGETRTWGIVAHSPDFINRKLPGNTRLSLFYNSGENFKADAPRGDIFGNQIPNPTGETEEYGFVVSTLKDRLSVKVAWYETSVTDATLQADSAGFSGNLYYSWAIPYWGATHSLAALDGIADPQLRQGSWGWPWNGIATMPDPNNPGGDPIPDKDRIFEIVQDFFQSFPLDQRFADEYGLGMNVEAMRAATTPEQMYAAVPKYGLNKDTGVYDPNNGLGAGDGLGLQPAYSGNLRSFGTGPVASVDTISKGVEIEVNARILDNWNLTFNVSKTEATRTEISPSIDEWIATFTDFLDGDAGLIKLWGGDPLRKVWADNILAPYSVLKGQIGSSAPEVSPWRFNLVSNYTFQETFLKGVNVGLAYRWQDKRILGYQYDPATDTLDIDRPWYGPTDDHVDLWVGYSRKIFNDRIDWRIQLNLRNVGEDAHLSPVNIQPDGTVALSRIQEGMTWFLTNTFKF